MPEFFEVVRSQRACRSYAPDPPGDDVIEQVLAAATFAPSAENRQPWIFVAVRDAGTRAAIGELTRRAWRGGARAWSEQRLSPGLLAEVDHGAEGGISGAPVLIVVCADSESVVEAALPASIFPAAQNLLLAATALGLGSALTTLPTAFGRELGGLVGVPEHIRPMAVVPIGYPSRALGPPRRQPAATRTFRDRFGQPW